MMHGTMNLKFPAKGSSVELQMEAILGIMYTVNVIMQKGHSI
jgi:hypothetical protein